MSGKSGPDIVENGLVLCLDAANKRSYPGTGTTWTDLSGNSNNGTLTNGPTFSAGNQGSILFDGTNDYIDTANSTGLNFTNTTGTISLWFKTSTSFPSQAFLIAKNMDSTGGWGVLIDSTGTPYFNTKLSGGGSDAFYRYATVSCTNGIWHNVVSVFTTSTTVTANNVASMYIDGSLSNGASSQISVYGGNTSSTVQIGRRSTGLYYSGNISSVQIYNRALSATEVLQNYNATKSRFGR
jgi:hypothetical protein